MRRVVRFIASAVAVASLAMLGWHSFHPVAEEPSPVAEVTVWTAGAAPVSASSAGTHVALPDAVNAPDEAQRIPDVAFLRRAFPALKRIAIEGDGIDATDAPALNGLAVTWHRPAASRSGGPIVASVSAPKKLTVGQRLAVQGRVRGLRPGETITMTLEGPDGATQASEAAGTPDRKGEGEVIFSLASGAAAVTPGAFEWRLRLGPKGEPLVLGAVVAKPELPRVLILQVSPSVEGARLQRWLAEAGAPVTTRTRVSAEHVRFAHANDSPADFVQIDAAMLAKFDVVIARETALLELGVGERGALDEALRNHGLGLLVVDEPDGNAEGTFFGSWTVSRVGNSEGGDETRSARLRLRDGTELVEPITVLPAELVMPPLGRWLVRDTRERTLGVAVPHGRGWVARSLVTDTWRWLQGGHPEIFSTYWSGMLSDIARPAEMAQGRWSLENGTSPSFVDGPLRLSWVGGPDVSLRGAEVRRVGEANAVPVVLNLARDSNDPSRAAALFWPTHPGWHEVRGMLGGASMAFYVQPAEALPELRAARRHDVTARFAPATSNLALRASPRNEDSSRHRLASYAWFTVFLASAGGLGLQQRRS